jgi:hypothetical protein
MNGPHRITGAAALLLALAAGACDSATEPQPLGILVPSLTLEAVGDAAQLEATVAGSDLLPIWESLDPAVATVTRAGMVTAVSAGTARVRARIGSSAAEGTVTVLPPVSVAITAATRTQEPSGNIMVSLNLKNEGGRGYYRLEYLRLGTGPDGGPESVLRYLTDDQATVGMQIFHNTNLPGAASADVVVAYSREPKSLQYVRTGCIRIDGAAGCPLP